MKLKIYKLWEEADENDLKYIEVKVCGSYIEFFQDPDENLDGFECSKRFFKYEKNKLFEKMFKNIKPNYFIKIHHSIVFDEVDDDSSIAGYTGYAHINFFQKQYLDWFFDTHWVKNPKIILDLVLLLFKKIFK